MCFVPACFEILGMILLAPRLLGVSILDAAIMGTVVRSSLACRNRSENAEAYGRKLRDRKKYSSIDPCGCFCG